MNRLSIIAAFFALVFFAGQNALAQSGYDLFQKGLVQERTEGNLDDAIRLYKHIVEDFKDDRALVAKTLVQMGGCYEKLGTAEARTAYETVVRDFADQSEIVAQAQVRLAALGGPAGDKQAESGLVERQLWVAPKGYSLNGYSTDGRYITFSDENENGRLWQHDLTTGEDRKLIEDSGGYWGSTAISPDGKQIAYSWFLKDALELRVIGIDGSRMRVLLSEKERFIYPTAWSPDGKQILALLSKWPPAQIALISVADGSIQVLKSAPRLYPFSFSPDGQYILCVRRKDASSQATAIFAMSSDGSREATLVEGPGKNTPAVWAPDGRKVLFVSDRSGTDDLWFVRVVDGKPEGMPELVKPNVGSMDPLGFTRDGALYYGSNTSQSDVYVAELDPETGKISSKPERVNERFIGSSQGPLAWSPDGQFLAYNRSRIGGAPPTAVVRTVTTGEEREVPAKGSSPFIGWHELRWFPDGRSLLVNDLQNNHTAFRRIDLQTGEGKTVLVQGTDSAGVHWQAALSHDGMTLFYSLREHADGTLGTLRLMRREIESGEERELYRTKSDGSGLFSLSLSPDEKQVAFVVIKDNTTPLMVVPAEGGSARELCPKVNTIGGTAWTKDGRHILVPGSDSEHPQQLLSVPIAGGQPQPTSVSMAQLSSPSIHPDGRRVAFAGGQSQQSVWAINNLLAEPKASR